MIIDDKTSKELSKTGAALEVKHLITSTKQLLQNLKL